MSTLAATPATKEAETATPFRDMIGLGDSLGPIGLTYGGTVSEVSFAQIGGDANWFNTQHMVVTLYNW